MTTWNLNAEISEIVEKDGKWVAIDENGRTVESYPERFTAKLRQHGIMDVEYDPYSPFIGRNKKRNGDCLQNPARTFGIVNLAPT